MMVSVRWWKGILNVYVIEVVADSDSDTQMYLENGSDDNDSDPDVCRYWNFCARSAFKLWTEKSEFAFTTSIYSSQ
jgi:hypothetical protein